MMLMALILTAAPVIDVTAYPFTAQVNPYRTQQFAHVGAVSWRASDGFGVVATAYVANPLSSSAGLSDELIEKVRAAPQQAPMFMSSYFGLGTELRPVIGTLGDFELELLLTAGVGAASTRIQLKPRNSGGPATFGDSGWRPGFAFGAGLRVRLARWAAMTVALTDFATESTVGNVNGCSPSDLRTLDLCTRGWCSDRPPVSTGCRYQAFQGVEDYGDDQPANDRRRSDDIPLAYAAAKSPRGELIHNVQLMLGFTLSL